MSGYNINLKEEFRNYFDELEGFTLRSERFYAECEAGIMTPERILEWLESAYMVGAKTMAQDTLDTLSDYACVTAGLEPELIKPETVYDRAFNSLHHYYTVVMNDKISDKILDKIDKIDDKI